ncbi:MAG: hypothetical protein AAGJ94_05830 [Pseudomonadota bacterium]
MMGARWTLMWAMSAFGLLVAALVAMPPMAVGQSNNPVVLSTPLPLTGEGEEVAPPLPEAVQTVPEAGVIVVPPPPTIPAPLPAAPIGLPVVEAAPTELAEPQPLTTVNAPEPFAVSPDATQVGPPARQLIEEDIEPAFARAASAALRLQNAVLRHCITNHAITLSKVRRTFRDLIDASTVTMPLTFGSDDAAALPERLLTQAASTAFSSSQLDAMIHGRVTAPQTLTRLREQEPGLIGLPALERVMLRTRYAEEATLEIRCRLAVTIAANIRDTTARARQNWATRNVDDHWTEANVDLADRLRLRDLVQGTLDTAARFDRDTHQFERRRRNNPELPFAARGHALRYLIAACEGLSRQVKLLSLYTEPETEAATLLTDIASALEVGRQRLIVLRDRRPGDTNFLVPYDQATDDIIDRLPNAFGFDSTAFRSPIIARDIPATPPVETVSETQ